MSTSAENQEEKRQRQNQPELIGKQIYYKWISDNEERRISDIVLKAHGSINDFNSEFEAQ